MSRFSKGQTDFMDSLGLDYDYEDLTIDELEMVEDIVLNKLQIEGFDEDYEPTEIGPMC